MAIQFTMKNIDLMIIHGNKHQIGTTNQRRLQSEKVIKMDAIHIGAVYGTFSLNEPYCALTPDDHHVGHAAGRQPGADQGLGAGARLGEQAQAFGFQLGTAQTLELR